MLTATPPRHVHVEHVMGTVVSLDVRGAGAADAQAAFARLMVWLHDVDRRFSTYRLDSEVNRIDRGELPVAAASDDVRWVLDRCVRLCAETGGAFDERAEHVLAPRSGAGPSGVLSVTVVGPDLGLADAYSTAAYALGLDGAAWTLGLDRYDAMTILADGQVLSTPGFPA